MVSHLDIGTPPQPFNTIISLHTRDLLVLSSANKNKNWKRRTPYNSSSSKIYSSNGTEVKGSFCNAKYAGFTSKDNIHIAGLTVLGETFVESTKMARSPNGGFMKYEGLLGLGAQTGNSTTGMPNIVTSLYFQGLISRNLFSLTITSYGGRGRGADFGWCQ